MRVCNMTGEKVTMVTLNENNYIETIDELDSSRAIKLEPLSHMQINEKSYAITYDYLDMSLFPEESENTMHIVDENIFNILSGVRTDLCYPSGEVVNGDTGEFLGYTSLVSSRYPLK